MRPSDRARRLLQGAYDTHIHVGPDVVERKIDDVSLARRFQELGMAGFILKSHYTSTAERAAVVRKAVPGIEALGAIALNRAVGGLNVGDFGGHVPLPAKITIEALAPIDLRKEFGEEPDVDEIYDHVIRLMQDTLSALAAERRLPVIG